MLLFNILLYLFESIITWLPSVQKGVKCFVVDLLGQALHGHGYRGRGNAQPARKRGSLDALAFRFRLRDGLEVVLF